MYSKKNQSLIEKNLGMIGLPIEIKGYRYRQAFISGVDYKEVSGRLEFKYYTKIEGVSKPLEIKRSGFKLKGE